MTLVWYLSRQLGASIVGAVAMLTILALALDLLEQAPDLLASDDASLSRYALLQAAIIGLSVLPVAMLTGATVGFYRMGSRNELMIIRGFGVGILGLLRKLLPLCALLGACAYGLSEVAVPHATRVLAVEFGPIFNRGENEAQPLWLRTSREVLRHRGSQDGGRIILEPSLFRLDNRGALAERIDAAVAEFTGESWRFVDGVRRSAEDGDEEVFGTLDIALALTPDRLSRVEQSREAIRGADARQALGDDGVRQRSDSFYEVRAASAWAGSLVPLIMLVLAAPAGLTTGRSRPRWHLAAIGMLFGFAFIVVDGIVGALGERGLLAPAIAVWSPPALFLLLGFWVVFLVDE